jgi:hypothetical protein
MYGLALLILGAAATAQAELPPKPLEAAEAIALADASKGGQAGRFAMTVASTGHVGSLIYLNSSADYRAPDDLAFRLAPNVVKTLTKRYRMTPDSYFRGKRVVVDGTIRRELIVNKEYGRLVSLNRWQHTVRILWPSQIVSAD